MLSWPTWGNEVIRVLVIVAGVLIANYVQTAANRQEIRANTAAVVRAEQRIERLDVEARALSLAHTELRATTIAELRAISLTLQEIKAKME